jgi:hypothetical protein
MSNLLTKLRSRRNLQKGVDCHFLRGVVLRYVISLCITCSNAVNNYREMLEENLVPFFSKQYRKKGKGQQTSRKERIQRNCEPHHILEPDELSDWLAFGLLRLSQGTQTKKTSDFFCDKDHFQKIAGHSFYRERLENAELFLS